MAARSDGERQKRLVIPRDLYLPETGPPRTKVRRPNNVPPLPPGMYLRESDGRSKRRKTK
jgi:hypothetical protein